MFMALFWEWLIPKQTVTHPQLLRMQHLLQPEVCLFFNYFINGAEHLAFHLLINCISSPVVYACAKSL